MEAINTKRQAHPCPKASEKKILDFLTLRGSATAREVGSATGASHQTAEIHLKFLFDWGKLYRKRLLGGGQPYLYSLAPLDETSIERSEPAQHLTTPFLFHSEVTCCWCGQTNSGQAWISTVLGEGGEFVDASVQCFKCHQRQGEEK